MLNHFKFSGFHIDRQTEHTNILSFARKIYLYIL